MPASKLLPLNPNNPCLEKRHRAPSKARSVLPANYERSVGAYTNVHRMPHHLLQKPKRPVRTASEALSAPAPYPRMLYSSQVKPSEEGEDEDDDEDDEDVEMMEEDGDGDGERREDDDRIS